MSIHLYIMTAFMPTAELPAATEAIGLQSCLALYRKYLLTVLRILLNSAPWLYPLLS